jgi:radical SAM protein with 4Fe4S-binding SPASM domain
MFEEIGVERIRFNHLQFVTEEGAKENNKHFFYLGISSSRSIQITNPSDINIDVLWEQMQKVKEKYGDKIIFSPENLTKKYLYEYYNTSIIPRIRKKKCLAPWEGTSLQANGDIIIRNTCVPYKVGNINEQTFKSIWNGKKYRYFRKQLKKYKLFPMCHRCCDVIYPKDESDKI